MGRFALATDRQLDARRMTSTAVALEAGTSTSSLTILDGAAIALPWVFPMRGHEAVIVPTIGTL